MNPFKNLISQEKEIKEAREFIGQFEKIVKITPELGIKVSICYAMLGGYKKVLLHINKVISTPI